MTRLFAITCQSIVGALILQSCAPKEECYIVEYCPPVSMTTINIIDRNGMSETISSKDRLKKYEDVDWLSPQPYEKVLRVYSRDSLNEIHAYITSYYENGLPKQYLEVVNARAKGTYLEWHENGARKLSATIIGGEADLTQEAQKTWLFDGVSEVWDDRGNLQAHFCYSKGQLEGNSIYYHANGNVWKCVPFSEGKIEGVYSVYLENEKVFQTTDYCQGKKNGNCLRYWPKGTLALEESFWQDQLTNGKYWDINGDLICNVVDGSGTRAVFGKESVIELQEIRNGIIEGEIKALGSNGEVIRVWHIQRGLKHGEEIEYYPTFNCRAPLKPMISIYWHEGKIQGVTKTWYPNGVQESQREMSGNKKNGILTAWYIDGSLMLMEEYDQDKLVRGDYYKKGERIPVSEVKNGTGTATLYDSEGHLLHRVEYVKGAVDI